MTIDNRRVIKIENKNPLQFSNVGIGAGTGARNPENAYIRNVKFQSNGNKGSVFYGKIKMENDCKDIDTPMGIPVRYKRHTIKGKQPHSAHPRPDPRPLPPSPRNPDFILIDLFLNNETRGDFEKMQEVMRTYVQDNFPFDQIGENFTALFHLLWPSSLPCHAPGPAPGPRSAHLLQRCVLHGQELDCARLFRPVATDRGICCSFNHRNVLRDSSFSRLLRSKQHGGGDGDDELHLTDIGKTMGLQVFVDQHSNRVSAGSVSATSK